MGEKVTSACLGFLNNGDFPKELNVTNLVLIPKKERPQTLADLHPIALFNVLYKIVSKVLANILKTVLPIVISKNQSAFIPGRVITDNIMIAFKVCHYLRRKRQGRRGGGGRR